MVPLVFAYHFLSGCGRHEQDPGALERKPISADFVECGTAKGLLQNTV